MERPRGFAGVRIDVGYHAALSRYVARARPNKSLHASRDCLFLKMLYQFIVAATARPRELIHYPASLFENKTKPARGLSLTRAARLALRQTCSSNSDAALSRSLVTEKR